MPESERSDLETAPLAREARRLYRSAFGGPPPDRFVTRFAEAVTALGPISPPVERARYRRAIDTVRDLEALELAARYTGDLSPLPIRMAVAMFVAETLPDHQFHFVNRHDSRVRAILAIALGVARTGYRLLKGLYLLRRLGRA